MTRCEHGNDLESYCMYCASDAIGNSKSFVVTGNVTEADADNRNFWVLQQRIAKWHKDCFGKEDGDIATNQLLGVVEEIGELTHHYLKRKQGIRIDEDHDAEIEDAIADITIYLMNFCTYSNINFQDVVFRVAEVVMKRTKKDQMKR